MFSHAAVRLASDCQSPYDFLALATTSVGWRSIVTYVGATPSSCAARAHSGRNQTVRGSLTTTASPWRSSPASHSRAVATALSETSHVRSHAAGRESLTVHAAAAQQLRVEVDHPARLAEAARVGVVGLHLGLRDVEAELAEDAGEQAGAAAADADDEHEAAARR